MTLPWRYPGQIARRSRTPATEQIIEMRLIGHKPSCRHRFHALEPLESRHLLVGSLVISEFLASNTSSLTDEDGDLSDWIEIRNEDNQPVDLAGWYLTDNANVLKKWQFPSVVLEPEEHLVVFASSKDRHDSGSQLHTDFRLNTSGEFLALVEPNGFSLADAFSPGYPNQLPDVSYGRGFDNNQIGFFPVPTPGRGNLSDPVADLDSQILVTEIMYHPDNDDVRGEYIELYNAGASVVNLSGWSIDRGVEFTFPEVLLQPAEYLVVAADTAMFSAKYSNMTNFVGNWIGQLSNQGERIRLVDEEGNRIDDVTYADEGDWAVRQPGPPDRGHEGWIWSNTHDGEGASLELVSVSSPNEFGQYWSASAQDQGTPGTENSTSIANPAPIILSTVHEPIIPTSSDSVTVSARIVDEASAQVQATLVWRVDGQTLNRVAMSDDGLHGDGGDKDGLFAAQIPDHPDRTVVEFFVEATDEAGHVRTWPAPVHPSGQQEANALYQVFDTSLPDVAQPGRPPVYLQIMTQQERDEFTNINRHSDAQMNATLIVVDSSGIDVRYNAGVRIRGSGSRNDNPPNNRINFPSDRPLRGLTSVNINTNNPRNQIAGSALFRLAGLPAAQARAAILYSNGVNLKGGQQVYAQLETLNSDYTRNQFPTDSDGNLYKGRRSNESPPGGRGAGLRYFGDAPEAYVSYTKLTNASTADYSDVINLTFQLRDDAPEETYVQEIEGMADVDQWLRFFALHALLDNTEGGLMNGDRQGDDYAMYRGVEDPRFRMIPHDLDSLFSSSTRSIFRATGVPALHKLFNHPEFLPRYYAQLQDLIKVVTSAAASQTLDDVLQYTVSQASINSIKDFLVRRTEFVSSLIEDSDSPPIVVTSLPVVGEFVRTTVPVVPLLGEASDLTQSVLVNGQPARLFSDRERWIVGQSRPGPILVPTGAQWQYLDDGSNQGSVWRKFSFEPHANWKVGAGQFGYGNGDENTIVDFGADPNNKHITTYFRHEFNVSDPEEIVGLTLRLLRDDGAAVYLNGSQVMRSNLPFRIHYDTRASNSNNDAEDSFFRVSVDPRRLRTGKNILAVEVHQHTADSDDLSFDLDLQASVLDESTGHALNPGINRLSVQAYDDIDGTGQLLSASLIDVWYDDGTVIDVSGTLSGNDIWSAADGPYHVTGHVTVPAGVILTIEPGTSVYFDENTRLIVQGNLKAQGTANERIRFTSVPNAPLVPDRPNNSEGLPNGPPKSRGIQFLDTISPENIIAFADIEHAQDSGGAIGLVNSELLVENVTFRGTHLNMINAHSSSLSIRNSFFPDMFAENESPLTLGLDNDSEHIKSVGALPVNGHFIIQGNFFGTNKGHNDVIDVNSGVHPGPIVQVLDNVFLGGGDDLLDLGGDVFIEGNVFLNVHKDNDSSDRGYASAISTGDTASNTTVLVTRNVFWEVDHAINLKRNAATIFESNTVVNIHDDFVDRFGNVNVGSAINLFVDEPGATPGRGAYVAENIFSNAPRVFGNADLPVGTESQIEFNYNLIDDRLATSQLGTRPGTLTSQGMSNMVGDPRFVRQQLLDFSLSAGSLASRTGPLGQDLGAIVPPGAWIVGEPPAITHETSATLQVGGPGIFSFRYRLNDGIWSEQIIGNGFDPQQGTLRTGIIELRDLPEGTHRVEVLGTNFAGVEQRSPTVSRTWTVSSSHKSLIINEVLARNGSISVFGATPDIIELYNAGGAPIELNGMSISDNRSVPDRFVFADGGTIQPGQYLLIFADSREDMPGIHTGFGLDADGEGVFLFAPSENGYELIDEVEFGVQLSDKSIGRIGRDRHWSLNEPTLGALNREYPTGDGRQLVINEWLAASGELFSSDFIELYNRDTLPVDMGGFFFTDAPGGSPTQHEIRDLTFVDAGGYLVFEVDGDSKAGPLHLNFKISRTIDELALRDSQLTILDTILLHGQVPGVSQGRLPDGQQSVQYFPVPTPLASNEQVVGDLNGDKLVDNDDIELLYDAVEQQIMASHFDINEDGEVNFDDAGYLVTHLLGTQFGDTNLDGDVDFSDFITFANNFDRPGHWQDGDFDGSGTVAFADFNLMTSNFGFDSAEPLPGDTNLDGMVDFGDFVTLANHFGETTATWSSGDFDGDRLVSFSDFIALTNAFGVSDVAARQAFSEQFTAAVARLLANPRRENSSLFPDELQAIADQLTMSMLSLN